MNALDVSVFNALYGLSGRFFWFDALIIAAAVYLPWAAAAAALYKAQKAWRMNLKGKAWGYALAFASGGLARGIVEIIRFYYHHPRPPLSLSIVPLFPETAYSFPSGHAAFFFGLAAGVYLVDKKFGRVLLICSAVIGIARVMAGVHWPSDILAGAMLGALVAWAAFEAWQRLSSRYKLPSLRP